MTSNAPRLDRRSRPNEFHEFVIVNSFISLFVIIYLISYLFCYFGRFPIKYERFGAHYIPNNLKIKNRRSGVPLEIDESKMCPFVELYDADLYDFLSNLRRVDGSLPVHPLYGPTVNLFAPKDSRKYWIRASTPVLVYFLFLVLDKVVRPFGMSSTLTCRFGTPPLKRRLTNCLMPK
jgi:hypothetical protein